MRIEVSTLGEVDFVFCPRCHRRLNLPPWLRTAKIECKGGITVKCGYCAKGGVTIHLLKSRAPEPEAPEPVTAEA